ncbi:MAG: PqqD family protein [Acidobacteria bacterium]|nr:MAG: PqqD family protein [Acidobacteriota bacterium]
MPTLNPEMVPQQATRVVAQQAAGQWVLLDVTSGQYYALDQVGGRIWQLCDGTRSVRQIAGVVSDEFDTAGQSVEDDVVGLVSELVGESLLV